MWCHRMSLVSFHEALEKGWGPHSIHICSASPPLMSSLFPVHNIWFWIPKLISQEAAVLMSSETGMAFYLSLRFSSHSACAVPQRWSMKQLNLSTRLILPPAQSNAVFLCFFAFRSCPPHLSPTTELDQYLICQHSSVGVAFTIPDAPAPKSSRQDHFLVVKEKENRTYNQAASNAWGYYTGNTPVAYLCKRSWQYLPPILYDDLLFILCIRYIYIPLVL